MYICIPLKDDMPNDIIVNESNVLDWIDNRFIDITFVWSDKINDIRGYINSYSEVVNFATFNVNGFDDITFILSKVSGDVNTSKLIYSEYEINMVSTDTIHPTALYLSDHQLTEFEIASCECDCINDFIHQFAESIASLMILSHYISNLDSSFNRILTMLFVKYILVDIICNGYDYYCECDDDDELYTVYKRFFDKLGISFGDVSIYECIDEYAIYRSINGLL